MATSKPKIVSGNSSNSGTASYNSKKGNDSNNRNTTVDTENPA